jgi:hypothetical protein
MLRPAHGGRRRNNGRVARGATSFSAKERVLFITICRLYETYSDAVQVVEALQVAGVPAQDVQSRIQQFR